MAQPSPIDAATLPPLKLDLSAVPNPLPNIVRAGDPVLRTPAQAVPQAEISGEKMQQLVRTMVAVMRHAPGVGLAAPQIGVPLRVIVVEDVAQAPKASGAQDPRQREGLPLFALFNPELTVVKGSKRATHFEGCLSVPGYQAEVGRHLEVEVRGLDLTGAQVHVRAHGWAARIFQHELDHLKGTLYVDKMNPKTLAADHPHG